LKVCRSCQIEKPDEAFQVCKIVNGKVYRRQKCHKCKRVITNKRRSALRSWLDDYKMSLVCERCGFADYRALEFHHSERQEKDFNVADMIRIGFSVKTIEQEIEKCIVLCSNCHQIKHYMKHK
jgi:hypothetical protein